MMFIFLNSYKDLLENDDILNSIYFNQLFLKKLICSNYDKIKFQIIIF